MITILGMKLRWTKVFLFVIVGGSLLLVYFSFSDTELSIKELKDNNHESKIETRAPWSLDRDSERKRVMSELGLVETMQTPPQRSMEPKIVYNRVGKCGSRSMISLLNKLSTANGFTIFHSPISNRSHAPMKDLLHIVRKINSLPYPSIYTRHIHYIDFVKFGMTSPIYINLIRDPIERFISHYNFLRFGDKNKAEGRSFSLDEKEKGMDINECVISNHKLCSSQRLFYLVPYFCGQDYICQSPNAESLYRAKVHVMENYLVVGYLEDFEGMLSVLEALLPQYFRGISNLWKEMSQKALADTSTLKKVHVNETARAILRQRLKEEYDFYNFVRLRFKILKKQINTSDY